MPGVVIGALYVLPYLIPQQAYEEDTIVPNLQIKKLRMS